MWVILEDYPGSGLSNVFGVFQTEADARNHAELRLRGFIGNWETDTWWESAPLLERRFLRILRLIIQPTENP